MTSEGKYGTLTIISIRKGAKNQHRVAVCICDCGETRDVRLTKLKQGVVGACVKCSKQAGWEKTAVALRDKNGDESPIKRLYSSYKSNALRKGIIFDLTYDESKRLFQGLCEYCSASPSNVIYSKSKKLSFIYNGIDRRDNSKGYTTANTVTCCSQCNYAKRDQSESEFFEWVQRVGRLFGRMS